MVNTTSTTATKFRSANFSILPTEKGIRVAYKSTNYTDEGYFEVTDNEDGSKIYIFPSRYLFHFINRLQRVKNMAESVGGDVTWTVDDAYVMVPFHDEWSHRDVVRREELTIITVKSTLECIKKEGYNFIGAVYPLDGGDSALDIAGLVSLAPEYKDDMDLVKLLEHTSGCSYCSGCRKKILRSVYYTFENKETKEIEMYGGSCAAKMLGLDTMKKIGGFFDALHKVGNLCYMRLYGGTNAWGEFEGEYEYCGGSENTTFDTVMFYLCETMSVYSAYTKIYGKIDKMKEVISTSKWGGIMDVYEASVHGNLRNPSDEALRIMKQFPTNAELVELADDMGRYYSELEPTNDFEAKMKVLAVAAMKGGVIARKTMAKSGISNPDRFYPYIIDSFMKKRGFGKRKPIEEFGGVKEFKVVVCDCERKLSKNGNAYMMLFGKTVDGDYVAWNTFSNPPMKGETLVLMGEFYSNKASYNGQPCLYLTKVKVPALEQKNESAAAAEMLADGTRLKGVSMDIVKVGGDFAIVKDAEGREYYVKTFDHDEYDGTVVPKFDVEFTVGKKVTLTGTVSLYTDKYGQKKATLKRIMRNRISVA